MNRTKHATSFRLSTDGVKLLDALNRKLGSDKTAVIELAIRRLAEIERVSIDTPKNDNSPTIAQ